MPSSRARINSLEISFEDYLVKNASAKGKRVSTRVVRRVSRSQGDSIVPPKKNLTLPGIIGTTQKAKQPKRSRSKVQRERMVLLRRSHKKSRFC